jgi:hypothetical protein
MGSNIAAWRLKFFALSIMRLVQSTHNTGALMHVLAALGFRREALTALNEYKACYALSKPCAGRSRGQESARWQLFSPSLARWTTIMIVNTLALTASHAALKANPIVLTHQARLGGQGYQLPASSPLAPWLSTVRLLGDLLETMLTSVAEAEPGPGSAWGIAAAMHFRDLLLTLAGLLRRLHGQIYKHFTMTFSDQAAAWKTAIDELRLCVTATQTGATGADAEWPAALMAYLDCATVRTQHTAALPSASTAPPIDPLCLLLPAPPARTTKAAKGIATPALPASTPNEGGVASGCKVQRLQNYGRQILYADGKENESEVRKIATAPRPGDCGPQKALQPSLKAEVRAKVHVP